MVIWVQFPDTSGGEAEIGIPTMFKLGAQGVGVGGAEGE